jgi:hypothetical protein
MSTAFRPGAETTGTIAVEASSASLRASIRPANAPSSPQAMLQARTFRAFGGSAPSPQSPGRLFFSFRRGLRPQTPLNRALPPRTPVSSLRSDGQSTSDLIRGLRENARAEGAVFAEHGLGSRAKNAVASVASAPSDGSVAPAYHSIPARTRESSECRASDGPVSSLHRFCRVHCRFILRATPETRSPFVSVGVSLASATSLKLCARRTLPRARGNQPWSTLPRRRDRCPSLTSFPCGQKPLRE